MRLLRKMIHKDSHNLNGKTFERRAARTLLRVFYREGDFGIRASRRRTISKIEMLPEHLRMEDAETITRIDTSMFTR